MVQRSGVGSDRISLGVDAIGTGATAEKWVIFMILNGTKTFTQCPGSCRLLHRDQRLKGTEKLGIEGGWGFYLMSAIP